MTGVDILSTKEVGIAFDFDWGALVLVGLIFFLGGFATVTISGLNEMTIKEFFIVSIFVGLIAGCIAGVIAGFISQRKPIDYETHYKVTVDDSVSMNEFNEKYEIIDQEGKIYTVREK